MWSGFLSLSPLDKVFAVSAVVGGFLFLVRAVLQAAGGHFGGGDLHLPTDIHVSGGHLSGGGAGSDSDFSFHILTFQGLTVFFLMFGMCGLSLHLSLQMHGLPAGLGAAGAAVACIWILERLMHSAHKLESSGNVDMENAVGQEGTVYLHIPPGGTGKVNAEIQGRLMEVEAVSRTREAIPTGTRVRVVDVNDGGTLVVEKIEKRNY